MPRLERGPTQRERAYLEALAHGEKRPAISGQAGHMCRKLGWCEALFVAPDGVEMPRSALPSSLDAVAVVRAGYRAVGYALTAKGRRVMGV